MTPRLKIKTCILSTFAVVITCQVIALIYLKIYERSPEEEEEAPPEPLLIHRPSQQPLNVKHPMFEHRHNFRNNFEAAEDVNVLQKDGQEDLKIIKSRLGADKIHADDGLNRNKIRRQNIFGFQTSPPLVIDTAIFDKISEKSECSRQTLADGLFCLPETQPPRMQVTGQAKCMVDTTVSIRNKRECRCKAGWFGTHCSIPETVEKSDYPYEYGVRLLNKPRHIIYAFPFSYEFEMLEARMMELGEIVDVFIIVESNYTAYGRPKPKLLWDKLQDGYLEAYQNKMIYVFLDYFPEEALRDGWFIDELLRNYITVKGLSRLRNVDVDDVIIVTDGDELPSRDIVTYLKIHFGYPEPIAFYLRHNTFNFRWLATDVMSRVFGAVTIGMLRHVFTGHAYYIRRATTEMNNHKDLVDTFKYRQGGRIHAWSAGAIELPVGWHCSWCMTGDRIKSKLLAAHVSDVPRWGSFPDKTKLEYINRITANGMWFDDKTKLLEANLSSAMYAPMSMLAFNDTKYNHLFNL